MKKHKALAASLTAALLLTCTPLTLPVSAEAVELVNDTFEESFGTWKARTSGSTEILLSDAQANSGAKSLFVKGRTVNWNGAGASMIGVMYPDQKYDLSVAVYYDDEVGGQSQQFNLQCLYTDANGKENYKYISSVNAQAGTWATIKGSYTVPSDASNIVVYVEAATLSDFYMDDFTVNGEKIEKEAGNDGFSDNFDDGTKMSWQTRGSQTTLEVTDKAAHSGDYSLYTDGRQQLWNGATCNKTLVLEAGGYYRFGCWVMYDGEKWTDTQKFSINLQYDLDGKENYYTIYTETANKGEWTYVGTECTIPEGASNLYVYVQTAYKPEASVTEQDLMGFYLDDVSAERLPDPAIQDEITALQDAYKDYFKVGCAVAGSEFSQGATKDLILKHYNSVTIGNELKPEAVLDQAATVAYMNENGDQTNPQVSLKQASAMLKFCEDNGLDLRGHVLVWHSQTPDWFFKENYDAAADFVSPEVMDQRMENYIKNLMDAIATQYPKLHVYAWDVVNEAASDSGTIRKAGAYSQGDGSSGWVSVYGDQSYIQKAFTYARKYAPSGCKLFYNDYNEYSEAKRLYIQKEILQPLVDAKLIDGMGMQSHIGMSSPSIEQYENAMRAYADMGLEVQVTELDVSLRSNSREDLLALAERYRQCFEMYKRVKDSGVNLSAVILWGITDSTSWIGGYPLLFDKDYQAKDAYDAVIDTDAPVQTVKNARAYVSADSALAFDAQAANAIGSAGSFKAAWNNDMLTLSVNAAKAGTLTVYSDLLHAPETYELVAGDNTVKISFAHVNTLIKTGDSIGFDLSLNGENWNSLKATPDADTYGKLTISEIPAIANATRGTVKVDGVADAAWADALSVPISTFSMGTSGATGTAKLLWDADNLYVLAEVKDPVLSKASSNVYEQDTVEIFLDENNHKTSSYEADDVQVRVNYDNEKSITDGLSTDRFVSAAQKTADGYLVEIAIPSTLGGFNAGQIVGFDAQINDDGDGQGKRTAISNWYDLSGMGYTDVSGLGLLKLLGEGEEAIVTEPTQAPAVTYGDVNEDGIVDILDVIKLNKYLLGSDTLTDKGKENADVTVLGTLDSTDSLTILKCVVELLDPADLPLK
ncbi:MAG: endo-1,4-beta-xylanase [Oscillospiraceae bacterium]|nr:endo-1,4-beta-xylanase [Oscillospiraceae bacterium]